MATLSLSILDTPLVICRLTPTEPLPSWAFNGPFACVTRTEEELSIVCAEQSAAPGIQREDGWRALKVNGPLNFSLTGILANLASVLAGAGISIFAISTYDTDYILVRSERLEQAVQVLRLAGYRFTS